MTFSKIAEDPGDLLLLC